MASSISDSLGVLQDKLQSLTATATEAKELVYIAKSVEAVLGTDLLIESIKAESNITTVEVSSSTAALTLSDEVIRNGIINIVNPADTSIAATATYELADLEENDVVTITVGDNTFSYTVGATPTIEGVVDAVVAKINTAANWNGKHVNATAVKVGTTKVKITSNVKGTAGHFDFTGAVVDDPAGAATAAITESDVVAGADFSHGSADLTLTMPDDQAAVFVIQTQLPITIKLKHTSSAGTVSVASKAAFVITDGVTIAEVFEAGANTSVLTTKGDLEYHDGTAKARLPVGTEGQTLITVNEDVSGTTVEKLKWVNSQGFDRNYIYPGAAAKPNFDCNAQHHTRYALPNNPDSFTGFSMYNPYSMGTGDGNNYSAMMYKLANGQLRRRGHRTANNEGMYSSSNIIWTQSVPVPYEYRNKEVTQCITGYNTTWIIFSDGSMVGAGDNTYYIFGRGTTEDMSTFPQFRPIAHFSGNTPESSVRQLVLAGYGGSATAVVLTEAGTVWTAGRNRSGSRGWGRLDSRYEWTQVEGLENITRVWGTGNNRNTVYAWDDKREQLYGWGENHWGGLGQGNNSNDYYSAQQIPLPAGKEFKALYTSAYSYISDDDLTEEGGGNTYILMTDGTFYGVGNVMMPGGSGHSHQSFFQMGVSGEGHQIDGTTPGTSLERIWHTGNCQYNTWYGRLKNGDTVSWGNNGAHSMRGHTNSEENNWEQHVTLLNGIKNVKKVVFLNNTGEAHAACFLTDEGEVWTMGNPSEGHRGIGDQRWYAGPTRVWSPAGENRLQGRTIDIGFHGTWATGGFMALTEDFEMYSWGYNGNYQIYSDYHGQNIEVPFKSISSAY